MAQWDLNQQRPSKCNWKRRPSFLSKSQKLINSNYLDREGTVCTIRSSVISMHGLFQSWNLGAQRLAKGRDGDQVPISFLPSLSIPNHRNPCLCTTEVYGYGGFHSPAGSTDILDVFLWEAGHLESVLYLVQILRTHSPTISKLCHMNCVTREDSSSTLSSDRSAIMFNVQSMEIFPDLIVKFSSLLHIFVFSKENSLCFSIWISSWSLLSHQLT